MQVPYLIIQFAPWLAAALVLGLGIGACAARTARERRLKGPDGWLWVYLVILVAGVVAARTWLMPNERGLWLDSLVLFGAVYLAGCLIGGALARRRAANGPNATTSAA